MANIFLSVPVLGRPELKMMYSMYQAILSSQHRVRVYFNENDSLISRVRNVHLSAFYNDYTDCDYFCSLDSDIQIHNCSSQDNIFDNLIANDVDFCGGVYSIKKPGPSRCSSIAKNGEMPEEANNGLVEMKWLSSGCWCIKRSAIEKLINAYPELHYDGDDNASGKKIYGLYIPMIYDLKEDDFTNKEDIKLPFRKYLSEDWSLCQRWLDLKGKIYADTSIVLKHIGKIDYVFLKEKSELPPAGYDL